MPRLDSCLGTSLSLPEQVEREQERLDAEGRWYSCLILLLFGLPRRVNFLCTITRLQLPHPSHWPPGTVRMPAAGGFEGHRWW